MYFCRLKYRTRRGDSSSEIGDTHQTGGTDSNSRRLEIVECSRRQCLACCSRLLLVDVLKNAGMPGFPTDRLGSGGGYVHVHSCLMEISAINVAQYFGGTWIGNPEGEDNCELAVCQKN